MSDEIVEEIVEPGDPLPPNPVEHTPPPWAEELIAKVESISDALAEMAPNPVGPEVPGDPEPTDDNDETPVALPWTHRSIL